MDKDLLTHALSPSRKALFSAALQEHFETLHLNNASQVLTTSIEGAEILTRWLQDTRKPMPRSIAALTQTTISQVHPELQRAANIIPISNIQPEAASHAFAHIPLYRRAEALPILQDIFRGLTTKGRALVTITKRNPVEEIVLQTLSATGKVRSTGMREFATEKDVDEIAKAAEFREILVRDKNVIVEGNVLATLKAQVERTLDGILGQTGDGHSWESTFDSAWNREIEAKGGLVIEAFVLLAVK